MSTRTSNVFSLCISCTFQTIYILKSLKQSALPNNISRDIKLALHEEMISLMHLQVLSRERLLGGEAIENLTEASIS